MKKYIIILLLLCSATIKSTTIDTTHIDWSTSAWKNILWTPRQPYLPLTDSGHVVLFSDNGGIQLSYDYGATILESVIIPDDWNHTHTSVSAFGDTIYVGNNAGSGSPSELRSYVFVDEGSPNYLTLIGADTITGSYGSTFSINKLPGSDSLIGISHYDQGADALGNGRLIDYYMSNDNGETWAGPYELTDDSAHGGSTRSGHITNSNSFFFVKWDGIEDSIIVYQRKKDSSWTYEGGIFSDSLGRDYSMTIYDDTIIFIAATSEPQRDSIWFHYGFKHIDSADFYHDSLYVCRGANGITGQTMNSTSLTYIEESKSIVASFIEYSNDFFIQDSVHLMVAGFNWVDSTFDIPIRLSDRFNITNGTRSAGGPQYIPAAHKNIIPYFYCGSDGGADHVWISLATFTEIGGVEFINSIPITISASGDYMLIVDDTTTGDAISITANNVNLDLNNHTVGFGSSLADDMTGINITGDNVYLHDGFVNHDSPNNTSYTSIRGVHAPSVSGLLIRNVDVLVKGYCANNDASYEGIRGFSITGNSIGNRIVSSDAITDCSGFNNRLGYAVRGIAVIGEMTYTPADATDYHVWIDSCYISSNYLGIQLYGREALTGEGYCWISNCIIEGNAKNDGPYIGFPVGNAYSIHVRRLDAVKIWNNIIVPNPDNLGNLGIMIELLSFDYGFGSEVYNNICTTSIGGGTPGGADDHSTAFRTRLDISHLLVYDNIFVAYSDTNTLTTNRGGSAFAINLGTDGNESVDEFYVYNNEALAIGDAGSEAYAVGVASKQALNTFVLYNNNLQTNNIGVLTAKDDQGTAYLIEHDDTISFVQDSGNTMWTYDLSDGNNVTWVTDSFLAVNNVYLGGAADNNIELSGSATQEIQVKYTITLTALDVVSSPVNNASVWCVNSFGDTLWKGLTNPSGIYIDTVETFFMDNSGTINYNNMTIGAGLGADTTTSIVTVGSTNREFILNLSATEESQPKYKLRGFKK